MGEDVRAAKVPRVDPTDTAAGGASSSAAATADAGAAAEAAGAADAMQVDAAAAAGWPGAGDGSSSSDDGLAEEVIRTVRKGKDDPLAAYDIDVTEDGEAIHTYLSMLDSAAAASSSSAQAAV